MLARFVLGLALGLAWYACLWIPEQTRALFDGSADWPRALMFALVILVSGVASMPRWVRPGSHWLRLLAAGLLLPVVMVLLGAELILVSVGAAVFIENGTSLAALFAFAVFGAPAALGIAFVLFWQASYVALPMGFAHAYALAGLARRCERTAEERGR